MKLSQWMAYIRVILLTACSAVFLAGPSIAQNAGPVNDHGVRGGNNAGAALGPNGATAGVNGAPSNSAGEANRAGNPGVVPTSANPNQYGDYASSGGYGLWGLVGLLGLLGLFRGGSRPITPDYTRRP